MTKSFRKSLDKIVNKRDSKSGEHSVESADSEKDDASTVGNSIEIIDEQNDQQEIQRSPKPSPLIANPNLMLELNAKLGKQISSEVSLKTETPPPLPSSPKPTFKDSPPSLPQEPKPKSRIPRFSRSDSLVENANKNDDQNISKSFDEPRTSVNTRKVSTSKIPKMISVKSSPVLIQPSIAKSENQGLTECVDQIEDLKVDIKEKEDKQESGGQKIDSTLDSNDARDSLVSRAEEKKTKRLSSSVPKSMSSSKSSQENISQNKTETKAGNQKKTESKEGDSLVKREVKEQTKRLNSSVLKSISSSKSSQESINQNKTEIKEGQNDISSKSVDVTSEEKKRKSSSSIPILISTTQSRSKLPIPEDEPRSVSLPSLNTPPGKVSEKKESSSETNTTGITIPPRKLSDSKIPQPVVEIKNDRENLKSNKTLQNKQEHVTQNKKKVTQNEQIEEFKDPKMKEEDDNITDQQTPEIEGSPKNDMKNDKEDLKPAKTLQNKQEQLTPNEQKEEFKESKIKEADDKIIDQQMPEIEGSSKNDTKDPVTSKVSRTQKSSVPSMMLDDALSEFQKEVKITGDDA